MTLESNEQLAARGGEDLKAARTAVQRASQPDKKVSDEEKAYRIYTADRLIQTAEWRARSRLAEDQRKDLVKEHENLVLEARTMEADRAREQARQAKQSAAEALALREQALLEAAEAQRLRDEAELARSMAMESQVEAESLAAEARTQAEIARLVAEEEAEKARQARADAEAARTEMESLRGRLSELEAKQTERGLLITLGDVLFEFNKSELKPGGQRNLLPLAEVLKERTEQAVIIEGHTDSIGSHAYNLSLSEKRAQSVEQFLVDQGIDVSRISTKGLGPDFPVADNASEEGRQRNRRVEVILPNLK